MFEAYDYISPKHLISLLERSCPFAKCKSNQHGYTCSVEAGSRPQSFAVIKEGQEETFVYYDTQAARKRTQLHPTDGREYETDHVLNRVTDPQQSPHISDYLQQHEDRLVDNRDEAPDAPLLGAFGKDDCEHLYDVIFESKSTATEDEVQDAFRTEVKDRRQQLNADDLDESRHDTFGPMFGWRIEPLEKRDQPDIVLELLLLGAYEQVAEAIDS